MRHAALFVALLTLLAAGAGAATVQAADTAQPARVDQLQESTQTTLRVQLEPDGDARWNVTTRFSFRTENETAAFERLAADYEDGETDTRFSTDVFRRVADQAESETGREMQITGVNRTADVGNESGRLTLQFTWTNFSRTTDDRIVVGDVFRFESGTWFSSLSADQTLVIAPPEGYDSVRNSPFGVDNGTIRVEGPRTFESEELSFTYPRGDEPDDGLLAILSELPPLALALAAVGLVGGLGVVYVLTRSGDSFGGTVSGDDGPAPADDASAGSTPAGGGASAAVDEDLLSDEERVERLLEQNGGRMMQANIVKETKWSNAKVSQLLSAMEDEGRINKLRIGRENLITFPDEDVSDFDS